MTKIHPRRDDHGHTVPIKQPSMASPAHAWADLQGIVTAVPDSPMPDSINDMVVSAWADARADAAG